MHSLGRYLGRHGSHLVATAGLLCMLVGISAAYPQSAGQWTQEPVSYLLPRPQVTRDYSLPDGFINAAAKTAVNAYWMFFSELDGDRCPFHPTCSNFLVSAVKEEGIIQGYLMFVDRFIRDSNPFFRERHYPLWNGKKFYDPVANYTLHPERFRIFPAGKRVPSQ